MNTSDCRFSTTTPGACAARGSAPRHGGRFLLAAWALAVCLAWPAQATTPLADQPVFTSTTVPGNLVLALSVEFPTAVSVAHQGKFVPGTLYLGYFDPAKCYRYVQGTETGTDLSHFTPVGTATAAFKCTATGLTDTWSGSFMNWLTLQAIDPFRWALTGGLRAVDTATTTILERAWAPSIANQGEDTNFPLIPTADALPLKERPSPSATEISEHTPFTYASLKVSVRTRGIQIWFTSTASLDSSTGGPATHYSQATTSATNTLYSFYARVKVCEAGAGYSREANCVAYPAGGYKPEGLLQQYATKIRFSAFGYLNDPTDDIRDGGVLRAKQKFVGPTQTVPGAVATANAATEWDANSGIQIVNPNPADATATASAFNVTVNNSGVINYLNKFGQAQQSYKRRDPVSELYYGALRYLKNQGHVPAWTNGVGGDANRARLVDGFPVITAWDDPIQYSCQKNFILGIGDTNTNWDWNVPGGGNTSNEPTMPSEVSGDATVNARTATNKVGELHGMGATLGTTARGSGNYLIAGLAYDAHTKDIRPTMAGMQTVTTYWLDVLEYGSYLNNNQYYLAAKFGGFTVPAGFDPYARTTDLPQTWWRSNTDTVGVQPRPDNYFTASRPDQVVAGLAAAFASISNSLSAFTTSFATALPQVALTGTASFGARYDSANWTGDVDANSITFAAATGNPTFALEWTFSARLTAQLAQSSGTGWNTNRRMVTWNTTGVPFRHASLSTAQKTALDTVYRSGDDSADYVSYLRGEPKHEENSTATGSARIYRNRASPVGDISGSKVRPVGPPAAPFSNAANPGYGAFKSTWATRRPMVFVGTNAGVLHAIDGTLSVATSVTAGQEVFAYVPSALYQGPTGTPITNGLMSRGDPNFTHKALIDGSAATFDIDLARTGGATGSPTPNWRTVLVGSLGKGGKSYFAIDVTDPTMGIVATDTVAQAETKVAAKVMWEFSHADLGYTYGEPLAMKTRKWGWVLVFGSGYNNTDGQGYIFIVNPATGALLQRIGTGLGAPAAQAGLAHVQAFILDRTDGTADAIYAGDLLGNVWRFDVTGSGASYPAPVQLAQLTNGSGNAVPITVRPMVFEHPTNRVRYVTVGSGKLLDTTDISSTQLNVFAAIMDGNGSAFGGTLPAGVSYPIQRGNLAQQTDLTQPVTVASTQRGWWLDLGASAVSGGPGWRVITESTVFSGRVSFASMLPSTDACSPSGSSRVYSIDVLNGKTELASGLAFIPIADQVIDVQNFSVGGTRRLLTGDVKGFVLSRELLPPASAGLRRLNWRELPLAD